MLLGYFYMYLQCARVCYRFGTNVATGAHATPRKGSVAIIDIVIIVWVSRPCSVVEYLVEDALPGVEQHIINERPFLMTLRSNLIIVTRTSKRMRCSVEMFERIGI